ncbi:kynurenine--oxoglutarate transaminase 3-like isoform X2 [Stylophora pistillata]|uniref:Kynurenine--oxoglutarate transaminase 3 n=2 Tax=Stylophora pistillata TaxID=50429 RepID=A0A2B4SM02_STYPI|nr:kynurenine--oxoglutarate transaminase 3-like isoform X2 [Stylophora pistillata]XP_022782848.1 kynurenine--oxoglutarate transaminase 3-like isoform X2 [Stylophora pistillata]XP_022782849.1 kynurenine--oxoglutarate transaminase 3-like isoform X2 [Stylophora pistillata]PFX30386.1 Kynurenine--oxoglutarate transaminase 3 [Stylophora pistillata]
MSSKDLYKPADRNIGFDKNVWVEFTALARNYKAVNLGQGFPDMPPPHFVKEALGRVATSSDFAINQYTRSQGHPRLVNALGKLYTQLLKRQIDPLSEFLVTGGAYESLYCSFLGLVDPGDEVILIEPYFDCYVPQISVAGGIPKFVPLRAKENATSTKDWILDKDELEAAFSEKTRAIVINTPHNPIGKVFSKEELQVIADFCKKYNVICISDEVYEWLVYGGEQHIRIATLPGMWERTITIGSAGKTFSVTGWKLGWSIGPKELIKNLQTTQAQITYTLPTPTQEALAQAFEHEIPLIDTEKSYFTGLSTMLERKRDVMAKLLTEVGFKPIIPQGGYFMMADTSGIDVNFDEYDKSDDPHDYKFVRWLTKEKGIAAIPPSAFYSPEHKYMGAKYIRFCFIKEDSTLENGAKKLKEWKAELGK